MKLKDKVYIRHNEPVTIRPGVYQRIKSPFDFSISYKISEVVPMPDGREIYKIDETGWCYDIKDLMLEKIYLRSKKLKRILESCWF